MRVVFVATAIAVVGSSVVSAQNSPSRPEAQALIEKDVTFASRVTRTFGLFRGRCVLQFDPDAAETRRYAAVAMWQDSAGILKVTRRKASERDCGLLSFGASVITIEVTDAGRQQTASWPARPVNDPTSQIAIEVGGQRAPDFNVPLQMRRFKGITGIASPIPATGQVPVEFEYEFVNLVTNTGETARAIAYLRRYDTGWRLEKVDGFPVQPPGALLPAFTGEIPTVETNAAPARSPTAPSTSARTETPTGTPASANVPTDPARIAGRSITRAVVGTGMVGDEPTGVGSVFSARVPRIVAYLEGRGMRAGDVIDIVWIQPDGSTRARAPQTIQRDSGNRLWYGFSNLTPRTPLPAGSWRIDLILNGQFVQSIHFTVS